MIEQTIRIWSLPSGECKSELRGHDNVIECIAWAPESAGINISESVANGGIEVFDFFVEDYLKKIYFQTQKRSGPYLVSGARDKTIRMWDVTNGLCLFILVNNEMK